MTAKITVTSANVGHFDIIDLADNGQCATREEFEAYLERGPAVTIMADSAVVAIGGVALSQPWIGTCWLLVSGLVPIYGKTLLRCCRNMIAYSHAQYGVQRIQALVPERLTKHRSFALSTGLAYEGLMRGMAPDGSGMVLYSSVRGLK